MCAAREQILSVTSALSLPESGASRAVARSTIFSNHGFGEKEAVNLSTAISSPWTASLGARFLVASYRARRRSTGCTEAAERTAGRTGTGCSSYGITSTPAVYRQAGAVSPVTWLVL